MISLMRLFTARLLWQDIKKETMMSLFVFKPLIITQGVTVVDCLSKISSIARFRVAFGNAP